VRLLSRLGAKNPQHPKRILSLARVMAGLVTLAIVTVRDRIGR
jgi:hypothetical protein